MAKKIDKNLIDKGRELWRALNCDPVDHKLIRELLKNGAPVNFREPGDKKTDRTPLIFVVCEKQGDESLLDILLENGANANLVDCFGLTPLHLAAEKGNPSSKADVNKRNHADETPLHIAIGKEHHDVVSYLLNNHQGGLSSDGVVKTDGEGSGLTVIAKNVVVGDNSKLEVKQ